MAGKRGTRTRDATPDILERVSRGESLRSACAANKISIASFLELCEKDKGISEQYACARVACLETHADMLIEIADNPTGDHNRDRLRVDTRKWLLSKLLPKKYGEVVTQKHQFEDVTQEQRDAAVRAATLKKPETHDG